MGQILLEFDNKLKQSEIVVPLMLTSKEEVGDVSKDFNNQEHIQQTAVHGIISPLIEVNNTLVDFDSILNFRLESSGPVPTLSFDFIDKYGLIHELDIPKQDNEIRVQILPPFENAYKKIDLTFYISKINVSGEEISVNGIYKNPELTNTRFEAFGEMNTYELFKKIATDTKLGFATNVKSDDIDKRYIYCNNKSYLDLMADEIQSSGSAEVILDYWIDLWNNLNLADIRDRYINVDDIKDLGIWITGQQEEVEIGVERQGVKVVPIISNHPVTSSTELRVSDYNIYNKGSATIGAGTDKIYTMYNMNDDEYVDYLIQDGDVKKDIFINHEYAGEVYGNFNYFITKQCREAFMQKVKSENLVAYLTTPMLGLMRGHQVIFNWFDNNSLLDGKKSELDEKGFINPSPTSNIDLPTDPTEGTDDFKLDKNVSGQYLITKVAINFEIDSWKTELTLNKPVETRVTELAVPEEPTDENIL